MPYEVELISLRCNDAQEAEDEPYLLVNGNIRWGPRDMRTGSNRSIGQRVTFDHDLTIELRESDRRRVPHRKDESLGSMHLAEPEVFAFIRGDHGTLSHTFRRDRGIVGDASYTLAYDLH